MTKPNRTGIRIEVGLSPGQRTIGTLLHTLHLERLAEWVAHVSQAVFTVDGVAHEEPLYEAHFIAIAPGKHIVTMSLAALAPGNNSVSRYLWEETCEVNVQAEHVTVLEYTPRDGGSARFEVVAPRVEKASAE